jgi:hypothetical protein
MKIRRNFLSMFTPRIGGLSVSIRNGAFLRFCIVSSICSFLPGCGFQTAGIPSGHWLVSFAKDSDSPGGTSNLKILNTSDVDVSDILLGDFNGDKKADVFTTWGGKWRVSFGGTSNWQIINTSSVGVSEILLGDFNGDGKADVFTTWGGKWRVSFGGTAGWQVINTSSVGVSEILLGDFDGDRKADVFTTWGGNWQVSSGRTSNWQIINTSNKRSQNSASRTSTATRRQTFPLLMPVQLG